jgi:hypothetical protein
MKERSMGMAQPRGEDEVAPAATESRFFSLRATRTTDAPACAIYSSRALDPIPWLPPVMRAHLPLKSMEIISPSYFQCGQSTLDIFLGASPAAPHAKFLIEIQDTKIGPPPQGHNRRELIARRCGDFAHNTGGGSYQPERYRTGFTRRKLSLA